MPATKKHRKKYLTFQKQLLYETSDIIKQHHKKKLKCSFHHFTILQPFSTKAKLSKELSAHGRKPHLTMLNCRCTVGALTLGRLRLGMQPDAIDCLKQSKKKMEPYDLG